MTQISIPLFKRLVGTFFLLVALCPEASAVQQKMYWSDGGEDKIKRSNLDGTDIEDIISTGLEAVSDIEIDETEGKIYWVDVLVEKLQRANLDGSEVEELISFSGFDPNGIALDIPQGKIYISGILDFGEISIQRANLDGSEVETLGTGVGVQDIELDLFDEKMYWSNTAQDAIKRADLDGSDVEDVIIDPNSSITSLALDTIHGKIYWGDSGSDIIRRANLDGSDIEDVIETVNPRIALDVQSGKIYWTDLYGYVRRANLDGTEVEDVVASSSSIGAIALLLDVQTPDANELIESLIDRFEDIAANSSLKAVVASRVSHWLHKAFRAVENGQNEKAIDHLETFIVHVERLISSRKLLSEEGQLLIDDANEVIGVINEDGFEAVSRIDQHEGDFLIQEVPNNVELHQNHPNPFNPSTTIRFTLPEPQYARLIVYDMLGREIRRLVDGALEAGNHDVIFEAGDLPSGSYLYRIETRSGSYIQIMQLLK